MSIYEMYLANDMETGFWVKRRNWGDLCARITFVGELERNLPGFGQPIVRAELFSFSSGELKETGAVIFGAGAAKTWHRIPPPPQHVWNRARKRSAVAAYAATSHSTA